MISAWRGCGQCHRLHLCCHHGAAVTSGLAGSAEASDWCPHLPTLTSSSLQSVLCTSIGRSFQTDCVTFQWLPIALMVKTVRSCPTRPSVVCPLLPFPALDLWPISTLAFPSYLECIMLVPLLCLCTWCSLRLAHLSLHVDLVMSFFLFSDFSLVITSSGRTFLDISD